MSDQTNFNRDNRFCIARGPENCPACVASIHSVRQVESFATIPPELEPIEEPILGMCLISSSMIVVGAGCSVSDEQFNTSYPTN